LGSDAHMRTQLVVCSHGKYAEGLVAASEMILGPVEGVLVYGLMPGVSPDVWREQIAADFTRVRIKVRCGSWFWGTSLAVAPARR